MQTTIVKDFDEVTFDRCIAIAEAEMGRSFCSIICSDDFRKKMLEKPLKEIWCKEDCCFYKGFRLIQVVNMPKNLCFICNDKELVCLYQIEE